MGNNSEIIKCHSYSRVDINSLYAPIWKIYLQLIFKKNHLKKK
jgi:hypothetical protein